MEIGKLYNIMIEDCAKPGKEVDELLNIFGMFLRSRIFVGLRG